MKDIQFDMWSTINQERLLVPLNEKEIEMLKCLNCEKIMEKPCYLVYENDDEEFFCVDQGFHDMLYKYKLIGIKGKYEIRISEGENSHGLLYESAKLGID